MRGASLFGSLRGRLVLLALAVLLPAIAASGLLLSSAYHASRSALERQIGDQARALGLVVDRQLGQDRVLIQALGVAPSFRAGDWPAFEAAARAAAPGPDTWIAVLDEEGRQLLNTRARPGAPLPRVQSSPEEWVSLPDGTRLSGLVKGVVVREPVVATDLEVRLNDGRRVHLRVTRKASSFDRLWREQKFPNSWAGVVLDSRYRVVTRSRGGPNYVGRTASPAMQRRLASAPEGVAETRTLEGIESITGWSRSERGDWSFIVAAPRAEVVGAATQPLILAALIAVSLMAAGVALAWWMGRRLAFPVEALTVAARRLEQGETPNLQPCGVAEIDALGEAVGQAASRIAGHQAELQAMNASLEARVVERTRELDETTENLVQAQKLEAIGRLTGGVAHDFNNLLMAISGNLELMGRRVSDPTLLRYVDRARQATERGAKLTGQLLAFSRRQRLQPRPTDVNALALQTRDLLASTLGGAVGVEIVLADELWPAMADATQLELVIMNLAINARDAMPDGGVVTIRTANARRERSGPREESPPAGDFVVVAVTDSGSGMPPDVERRVFEPFFTTKEIGQGSGLGLPQVLGLAKQLGGGVEIVTAPGEGTTVSVFLPRAAEQPEPKRAEVAATAPELNGLAVLLVDDDADVRAVGRSMLAELGCRPVEASGGAEALSLIQQGLEVDVALVDFAMPGANGAEVADRLKQLRAGLPVVMMSGFADQELLSARWSGSLLHKPFGAGPLAAALAAACGGETKREPA